MLTNIDWLVIINTKQRSVHQVSPLRLLMKLSFYEGHPITTKTEKKCIRSEGRKRSNEKRRVKLRRTR